MEAFLEAFFIAFDPLFLIHKTVMVLENEIMSTNQNVCNCYVWGDLSCVI